MTNRRIGGVCGGIAKFFSLDTHNVRAGFIIYTVLTLLAGVVAYLVLWMVMPSENYRDAMHDKASNR